ncbi:MAG: sugar ABC transporter permease [Oscillospiraceae bacterium]|nr:sugar ABC transporter permease [Oscillospiraceae bacterium]
MKQRSMARNGQKHSKLVRDNTLTGVSFLLPSLILCAVFVIYPLINVIYYSFTDWDGLSSTKNFIGLYNYLHLNEVEGFGTMMAATFTFAAGVTILTILTAFLAALALDKKGKGRMPRGMMRALWFFPALLSGAVVGILWRIMYNYNNGVINSILKSVGLQPVNWLETVGVANIAIIIGATWIQVGMCVVIFMAGLQSIPPELYEAAEIDGASPRQRLRHITIPMMASSITINVVTTTIVAFKAYELPYLISNGQPGYTTLLLTQRIYFYGFTARDYGRGSALSVVLLVIIALISLIQLVVLRKREEIF